MYLTADELKASRQEMLDNLLAVADACLSASESLNRAWHAHGRRLLPPDASAATLAGNAEALSGWFFAVQRMPALLLEESAEVLGSAHSALSQAVERQIRLTDRLYALTIDRLARSSPWEGEVALGLVKSGLQRAENGLCGMAGLARQAVELAEREARHVADGLADEPPARRRTTRTA